MLFCPLGDGDEPSTIDNGDVLMKSLEEKKRKIFLQRPIIGPVVVGVEGEVVVLVLVLCGDDDGGEVLLHELLVNQYSTDTAIAVTKWMDELEFIVKIGDFRD